MAITKLYDIDCVNIIKIIEENHYHNACCCPKLDEKVEAIRCRSRHHGIASVLIALYSLDRVELIKDLTKMRVLCTEEKLDFSPEERRYILYMLFGVLLKQFEGDCGKLKDACRDICLL